ncbi:hypothetical protein LSH36_600g01084 [Paralvinella palmiformis]|uniref:RNA helicase n=1 Tax=Paralvinella palmiformis TaxID=53620 RepID=A0AAD9J6H1_9ANNE|nr:hypothetical protein LSH36_600g01084 [Paralvinella palmiformis]
MGISEEFIMTTISPGFKRPITLYRNNQNMKKQRLAGGSSSGDGSLNYTHLQDERRKLPIYTTRHRLLKALQPMSSAIVIGETGSGKTTQLPQYLYESGQHKKLMIACTQPRRVAAITVAQRVAEEMGDQLGHTVGYCVRFEDCTGKDTKIKYMTDGMLLREAIHDPLLKRYSTVILDECHERTIHTDVLFGVVKKAQAERKERGMILLKIIVMSATMDVDHFSNYFNKAPVLYIEGRQYTVKIMYTSEPQSDYVFSALAAVFQVHEESPPNEDILVFLTGQEEIESAVKSIKDIAKDLSQDSPPLIVCPMYAALPSNLQLRIFQHTPKGSRKVIVATNIAETSITIHGIKHVIDTGKVKAKVFNPFSGLDLLKVVNTSKAQAWQRSGRAGREAPGTCYRLYTESEYDQMRDNTLPEIQRCNLSSVILQLLALGIEDVLNFDFMDKPSKESLENAVNQLELLGAVIKDIKPKLTPEGRKMADFPLEPRLAKVILAAKDHSCLEEILTIVSALSVDSVYHTPASKKDDAVAVRNKFMASEGDHLTLLNIYRAYKGVNCNKQWCHDNFLNGRNLRTAVDVKKQLKEICTRQQLPVESCGQDTTAIRKCLCAGFFMNAAELQKEGQYVTVSSRKPVSIHPSSSIFQCKPAYVIYNELIQTSKCYMRDLSVVDADWLYDVAPSYFRRKLSKK